ncbi:MAG: hypothetical protein QXX55_01940 [Candidatus Pacearchaeota archaeon]
METKNIIIWLIIVFIVIIAIIISSIFLNQRKIPSENFRETGGVEGDSISVQCNFACANQQKFAFCDVERNVNQNLRTTCKELSTNPQYSQYGVSSCPQISCELTQTELDKTCVSGLNSVWVNPNLNGECPEQSGKFVAKREPSDQPPIAGQICCFYYD